MSSQHPFGRPLHRRHFFALGAQSLLFALTAGLTGCGSGAGSGTALLLKPHESSPGSPAPGSPGPLTPTPISQVLNGTVDSTQIGGTGLQVVSALAPQPSAVAGSSFATLASNQGAQLLFLFDSTPDLRGLAISLPSDTSLAIDASTTALALIFATLELMTADPTLAAQLMSLIQGVASFAPFEALVASALATGTLNDLMALANYDTLRDQVVSDVVAAASTLARVTRARLQPTDVTALLSAPGTGSTVSSVNFTNTGLRFVAVARELEDATPADVTPPVLPPLVGSQQVNPNGNLISGPNTLSIGNVLTAQVNSPGSATDNVDLTQTPSATSLVYWISGPGGAAGGETSVTPTVMAAGFDDTMAWLATVIFYVLGPCLDIVAGGTNLLDKSDVLDVCASSTSLGINIAGLETAVVAFAQTGTGFLQVVGGITDALIAIAGTPLPKALVARVGAALAVRYGADGAAAFVSEITSALDGIGATLGAIGAAFAAINFTKFIGTMVNVPRLERIDIKLKTVGYTQSVLLDTSSFGPGTTIQNFSVAPDGTVVVALLDPQPGSSVELTIYTLLQISPDGTQNTLMTGASTSDENGLVYQQGFITPAYHQFVDKNLDVLVQVGPGGTPLPAFLPANAVTPDAITLPASVQDVDFMNPTCLNTKGHAVGFFVAQTNLQDSTELQDGFYWDVSLPQAIPLNLGSLGIDTPRVVDAFINDSDVIAATIQLQDTDSFEPVILNFSPTNPQPPVSFSDRVTNFETMVGFTNSGLLVYVGSTTNPDASVTSGIYSFPTQGLVALPTQVVVNTGSVQYIPLNVNNNDDILVQQNTTLGSSTDFDFVIFGGGKTESLLQNGFDVPTLAHYTPFVPTGQGGAMGDGGHVALLLAAGPDGTVPGAPGIQQLILLTPETQ